MQLIQYDTNTYQEGDIAKESEQENSRDCDYNEYEGVEEHDLVLQDCANSTRHNNRLWVW